MTIGPAPWPGLTNWLGSRGKHPVRRSYPFAMEPNQNSADTSAMPEALNRGYSNSFLDMLARLQVPELPKALTQGQLADMDAGL